MFQRALPEVDGFGVITSTPGLIRSSQPVMCLGLPLRTTNTTTRVAGEALLGIRVPVLGHDPVLDQPRHVRRGRERDHVGRLARVDRAALRARGAERLAEADALAGRRLRRTPRSARRRPSSASSRRPAPAGSSRHSTAATPLDRSCRRVRRSAASGEHGRGDRAQSQRPRTAALVVIQSDLIHQVPHLR